jgi:hypothetical protein
MKRMRQLRTDIFLAKQLDILIPELIQGLVGE